MLDSEILIHRQPCVIDAAPSQLFLLLHIKMTPPSRPDYLSSMAGLAHHVTSVI